MSRKQLDCVPYKITEDDYSLHLDENSQSSEFL